MYSDTTNIYSGRSSPTNTDSETTQECSFSAGYHEDYNGITTGRSTDIDGSIYSLGEDVRLHFKLFVYD